MIAPAPCRGSCCAATTCWVEPPRSAVARTAIISDEAQHRAHQLHQESFVFDGLTYLCDGTTAELVAGGVNATNITVPSFEDDWSETCQNISRWLERCAADGSPWTLIESAADFDRTGHEGSVGIVMGWQNMRPIGDALDRIGFFHKLGVRIMQPTYNYRNMMGNGCLEPRDEGLSQLGRDAVRIMNALGIAIDLSHVGERTTRDVIETSEKPVLVTHANAHALAPLPCNKSDEIIRAVAEKGGIIGPSIYGPLLWDGESTRPPTLDDYFSHVEHIAELVGIEHVGFGTDFPAVSEEWMVYAGPPSPRTWNAIVRYGEVFGHSTAATYLEGVDTQGDFPVITAAMLRRGWSEDDVRAYLGGNFRRVLEDIWSG